MKRSLTLILTLLVVFSARPAEPDRKPDGLLAKEEEISQQHMMQIYEAIQNYRKEYHDLPRFLSDLYPKYVSDTNIFLCPTAVRLHQEIPFPGLRDPKLLTHFGYEFNAQPVQVRANTPNISMAEWKRMQMMVVGGVVPMLRCFAYERVLNVSFDGRLYDGQVNWEYDLADKVNNGELEPSNLRARVLKDLGVGAPAPTGPVELTLTDAIVGATLSAGVHPVRQPRDIAAVKAHQQVDNNSCIPMSVEFVLKLLARVPLDYYDLQREWHNRLDGTFAAFDGRTIKGVKFRRQYALPRDENFPLNQLFGTVESELEHGRYVIISLPVGDGISHMWVVHTRLPSREFQALSKQLGTRTIMTASVQALVRGIHGTDILTYEPSSTSGSRP